MRVIEYRGSTGCAYEIKNRQAQPVMLGEKETRSEFLRRFGCPQSIIDKTVSSRETRSAPPSIVELKAHLGRIEVRMASDAAKLREIEKGEDGVVGLRPANSIFDCPKCGAINNLDMLYDSENNRVLVKCPTCGYNDIRPPFDKSKMVRGMAPEDQELRRRLRIRAGIYDGA